MYVPFANFSLPIAGRISVAVFAGFIAGAASFAWPSTTLPTLVVLCLAALLVLRQPATGVGLFAAIATLLPFAVVPIRLVFAPTLVDVALALLLFSWVLRALYDDEPLVLTPRHTILVLFMGTTMVSFVLGSASTPVSSEDSRLYLKLLASILLFVSAAQVVREVQQLTRVIQVLILGGAGAAAIALGLYMLPGETAVGVLSSLGAAGYPSGPDVLRTVAGTETVRATGTSVDPNVLGGMLMLCVLLMAGGALAPRPILPRMALAVIGAIALVACGLTYSRSAWVGLAAGFAYLAFIKDRRLLWAVGLIPLGFVFLPQAEPFASRLAGGLELRDQATLQRLDEYRNALSLIGQYPLFGIGFGASPTIEIGAGVSSLYLLIAEQTGLVGLSLFLAVVAIVAARGLALRIPRESTLWGSATGLQAALVGALVAGLFDHYFFNLRFPHMVALFWLLMGLLTVATSLATAERRSSPPR